MKSGRPEHDYMIAIYVLRHDNYYKGPWSQVSLIRRASVEEQGLPSALMILSNDLAFCGVQDDGGGRVRDCLFVPCLSQWLSSFTPQRRRPPSFHFRMKELHKERSCHEVLTSKLVTCLVLSEAPCMSTSSRHCGRCCSVPIQTFVPSH